MAPTKNMFRSYKICVRDSAADLFGSVVVDIESGRIGETTKRIERYFDSREKAVAFFRQKVREKLARGYVEVDDASRLSERNCFFCRLLEHPEDDPCFVSVLPRTVLIIGWDQMYRGRAILVLKKHLPDFFRVSHQESLGLLSDIKRAEKALRGAFAPDMMNYLFMGNTAQHAHLHLVPRYSDDPNFGSSPFLDTSRVRAPSLSAEEYRALAEAVRRSLDLE